MNCFNGAEFLHEALDSLLNQTYQNWELVFWDNQSTDQSKEIFCEYDDSRLRYFLAPEHTDLGGGRAEAWNFLRGDLICVLDTDDVWMPAKIEKQLDCFRDPGIAISITNVEVFSKKHRERLYKEPPPTGWVVEHLLCNYYVSLSSVMIHHEAIRQLEYAFDSEFSHIADFDLIVRASTVGQLSYVPEVLSRCRFHANSATWTEPQQFAIEQLEWLMKNRSMPLLAKYPHALKTLARNTGISRAIYFATIGQANLAREELSKLNLLDRKIALLFAICYLPGSRYIFRLRNLINYRKWF